MPKYELPELKEYKSEVGISDYDPVENDRWFRQIRLPVNKAIIDVVKVGDEVEVKLKGKVVSTEARETERGKPRHEMEIELMEIESYAEENEFSELADD